MGRLSTSFRKRNRTTRNFREQYQRLPASVQRLVRDACQIFAADPNHRSLRHHPLKDNRQGQHVAGSFSVSVTMQYRAIYVVEGGKNVWYWVGTHAEYDIFTGGK